MSDMEKRVLIYTVLFFLCSAVGMLMGLAAAAWTFAQVAAVAELIFMLSDPARQQNLRR